VSQVHAQEKKGERDVDDFIFSILEILSPCTGRVHGILQLGTAVEKLLQSRVGYRA
jgi:hypothetical protein